jgi:hypothetical protein
MAIVLLAISLVCLAISVSSLVFVVWMERKNRRERRSLGSVIGPSLHTHMRKMELMDPTFGTKDWLKPKARNLRVSAPNPSEIGL